MTLLNKRVFALTQIEDENLLVIKQDIVTFYGNNLYEADQLRKKNSLYEGDEQTVIFEEIMRFFENTQGKDVAFNTECIRWEEKINILDDVWLCGVAKAYMIKELGKFQENRFTEYKNFIKKLVGNRRNFLSIKLLQIGNNQYSCFTF